MSLELTQKNFRPKIVFLETVHGCETGFYSADLFLNRKYWGKKALPEYDAVMLKKNWKSILMKFITRRKKIVLRSFRIFFASHQELMLVEHSFMLMTFLWE